MKDGELKLKFYINLFEAFRKQRIDFLPRKVIDSICNDVLENKSFTFDKTQKNIQVFAVSLLLFNTETVNSYIKPLCKSIKIMIQTGTDVLFMHRILSAIISNLDFYVQHNQSEIAELVGLIYNAAFDYLITLDADQYDNFNLKDLDNLTKKLISIRQHINFVSKEALFPNENQNIKIKEYLDNAFQELSELKCNSKKSRHQVEKVLYSNSLKLHTLSNFIMIGDHYNKDFLFNLTKLNAKMLKKLDETKLLSDDWKLGFFNAKSLVEMFTLYGLFNYFDHSILTEDKNIKNEFKQHLVDLKQSNVTHFKTLNQKKKLNKLQLIEYNMSLINLNIETNDSINELFGYFKSYDDLKKHFGHMNKVRSVYCFCFIVLK